MIIKVIEDDIEEIINLSLVTSIITSTTSNTYTFNFTNNYTSTVDKKAKLFTTTDIGWEKTTYEKIILNWDNL